MSDRTEQEDLGVVLYEMFTHQLPFKGVHETALMYEIVNVDPAPMSTIVDAIDPELDRIVAGFLEAGRSLRDIALVCVVFVGIPEIAMEMLWHHWGVIAYYGENPTRILGVMNDCVVVADRSGWPASVWTADGLYAGSFLDRRADDGLPAKLYSWWREKRANPDKPGEFVNPQTLDPDTPIPFDVLGGFLLPQSNSDPLWMPMAESSVT